MLFCYVSPIIVSSFFVGFVTLWHFVDLKWNIYFSYLYKTNMYTVLFIKKIKKKKFLEVIK